MAGTRCTVCSSAVGTGTATTKTILALIAPAAVALVCKRASISFDGVSPTAGKIFVEIVRGAANGTGTPVAPVNVNASDNETPTSTAKENYSAEPSGGVVIFSEYVHPQGGYTAPEEIKVKKGEQIYFRTYAPAAVNARARFIYDE